MRSTKAKYEKSYLLINSARYMHYKRDALRRMVRYINQNQSELTIKTALDAMAGKGITVEYLLRIRGLEELIINDLARDCYEYLLKSGFRKNEKLKAIWNRDFFDIVLNKTDLVFVDFNGFTWNSYMRKPLLKSFEDWIDKNRNSFQYLLYSDSFYYSLKFLKSSEEVEEKFNNYLNLVEEKSKMKILSHFVYANKDCALILLKNEAQNR